jgi:hypothetical protein
MGKCFNCFASDHQVVHCRDPLGAGTAKDMTISLHCVLRRLNCFAKEHAIRRARSTSQNHHLLPSAAHTIFLPPLRAALNHLTLPNLTALLLPATPIHPWSVGTLLAVLLKLLACSTVVMRPSILEEKPEVPLSITLAIQDFGQDLPSS